jgi:hypothetical protein
MLHDKLTKKLIEDLADGLLEEDESHAPEKDADILWWSDSLPGIVFSLQEVEDRGTTCLRGYIRFKANPFTSRLFLELLNNQPDLDFIQYATQDENRDLLFYANFPEEYAEKSPETLMHFMERRAQWLIYLSEHERVLYKCPALQQPEAIDRLWKAFWNGIRHS